MQPLLHFDSVSKRYGSVTVLHGVDLHVADNEFLTILGPSGSGKTTILRIIGGFESIDEGRLMFEGRDLARVPINRRPFNTVFQDYALFHHMSVRGNVGYGLRVRGVARAEIARRVDEVLATVGLDQFGERFPAQLSGGQRQRVALARAIICEPRLILLDEPLAALDVSLRAQMQRFLKDLQRRLGIAFVFITHDQEEAIVLSDRIVVVADGRIEQEGTPHEIYHRPRTAFVANFFGENNVLEGRIAAADGGMVRVETVLGTFAGIPGGPAAPGASVLVAVRPEHIGTAATGENRLQATVASSHFLGPTAMLEVRPDAAPELRIKLRQLGGAAPVAPGSPLTLSWSAADTAVITRPGASRP
ncbi:ABC transporter ATP-binding protein [Labrys monachus]|uniref:Spermidine/putrescine transport system ATP-binding protein n=1 Tax=Labrys monachus TaxID=217067 RepID=A0ABU0FMJ4_9HYPH|nr:ABC transporter ATP-binding protein [Labrys monachus]MDQ0395701.1 spermidine/putrescine transport system ATP-binding protein [Labrys monachus]